MKFTLLFFFILFILSVVFVVYTVNRIYEKFVEDDPMLVDIRQTLEPVFPDINTVVLLKGKKSYTINKKKIQMPKEDMAFGPDANLGGYLDFCLEQTSSK